MMNDPQRTCPKGSTKWRGKDECVAVEINIFLQIDLSACLSPWKFFSLVCLCYSRSDNVVKYRL